VRDATVTKMLAAFFIDVSRARAWGGALGGLIPAVEPRLKIAVFHVAGLEMEQPLAEADPLNFVGHITIPVLMVKAGWTPTSTSRRLSGRRLNCSARRPNTSATSIYEAGHFVPRDQLVKETLDWFDRYLGPVKDARKMSAAAKQP